MKKLELGERRVDTKLAGIKKYAVQKDISGKRSYCCVAVHFEGQSNDCRATDDSGKKASAEVVVYVR